MTPSVRFPGFLLPAGDSGPIRKRSNLVQNLVQNDFENFSAAQNVRQKQKNPETASPRGAEDCKLFPGAMSSVFCKAAHPAFDEWEVI